MSEHDELRPILRPQDPLIARHRRIVRHRPVCGQNASVHEVRRTRFDRELKIAIQVALVDALGKCRAELLDVDHFHPPFEFTAQCQAQRH